MNEELARYEGQQGIVNIEDYAMSIQSLTRQVDLIQDVMKKVMKENEHYGKIPGTNKPTLLKPGAEKLNVTFRLGPSYAIIEKIRDDDFIAYTVRCDLTHIPTGTMIASGIGSCNSKETKYRYHTENTGREVPKEYWKDRDPKYIGGHEYSVRKKDGKWYIMHQVENENPWELDNTLVKMACKRALVAATLNGTAASDIFTQDVEDMPPELLGEGETPSSTTTDAGMKEPGRKSDTTDNGEGNVKDKLKAELADYCRKIDGLRDEAYEQVVLKNISKFGEGEKEKWITDIDKASDRWCGTSLGRLRELVAQKKG